MTKTSKFVIAALALVFGITACDPSTHAEPQPEPAERPTVWEITDDGPVAVRPDPNPSGEVVYGSDCDFTGDYVPIDRAPEGATS